MYHIIRVHNVQMCYQALVYGGDVVKFEAYFLETSPSESFTMIYGRSRVRDI